MGRQWNPVFPVFLTILLLAGCAKIQPPPGGPEDRTPPRVLGSTPVSGAVLVDRAAPVRIEFSEPVLHDKIGDAVYISPRPSTAPSYTWDKNALLIEWPESLAANLTYLVTVAARVPDRRGNRLAEPFTMAFSTGPMIDSGIISGVVFDRDKPVPNVQVLLFVLPLDSTNAVFAAPDYITECGPDGGYTFSCLPNGPYRAIAIEDKNKNRQLDRGEKAGAGAFDAVLSPDDPRSLPLSLYLRETDTTRFELVRTRVNLDRILLAEFSHPIDSLSTGRAEWTVQSGGAAEQLEIACLGLDAKSPKTARLLLGGVTTGVSYRLSVRRLLNVFGREIDSTANTGEFFWPVAADTVAPTILLSSPGNRETGVERQCSLTVWFSEAVDSAGIDTAFLMTDSTGERIAGQIDRPCAWELVFTPESALAARMTFMMTLDSSSVRDRAGNVAGSRWVASFTTVDPDNLGGLGGSLMTSRQDWQGTPIIMQFVPLETNSSIDRRLPRPGVFEHELAAGKYIIRAYVDLDENSRFDYGSVAPFFFAEPRFVFPDTLEVRARFVTEGIRLNIP